MPQIILATRYAVRLPNGLWVARMKARFPQVATTDDFTQATTYPVETPARTLVEIHGGEVLPVSLSVSVPDALPPKRAEAVTLEVAA
jgi:hypothetical protein